MAVWYSRSFISGNEKISWLVCVPRNKDGTLDKLTVVAISNINLEKAQIAFLSSCGTAKDVPEDPADESIYIGSGFQLAGFSPVISIAKKKFQTYRVIVHDAPPRRLLIFKIGRAHV